MIIRWLRRLARAVRALVRPGRSEQDLDEELRFHLDMDAADWERRGIDSGPAGWAARRRFGPLALIKEQMRDTRITRGVEQLVRDLRFAGRSALRSPGFALAVIVTLGLGVGAVATMYSISRGILRSLPVESPGRLVHVAGVNRRTGEDDGRLQTWDRATLAAEQRSLEGLAAYEDETFHVGDAERFAERWSGAWISAEVFPALRVRPLLGRTVEDRDVLPGAEPVVLLGARLWTRRYQADPAILGQTIRVNGMPRTVIGVMPEGMRFPVEQDLWLPLVPVPGTGPGEGPAWTVFGRLRDGVTPEQARAEFATLGSRLAGHAPATHVDRTVRIRAYRDELVPPRARVTFGVMLVVVSFVLLVACANAANLLLTRSVARRQEVAVRAALGAARTRLVMQLLTEVLVLAGGAGLLGLALAYSAVLVFNRMLAHELSFWMTVRVDGAVLLFALAAVLLATAAAGLGPARQAFGVHLGDVLRERARGSWRLSGLSRWLVGFEVALSSALLVITGLMVSGVVSQVDRFRGLSPDGALAARYELRADTYPDPVRVARHVRLLHDRLVQVPGVSAAASGTMLPGFTLPEVPLLLEGIRDPGLHSPETRVGAVSPGYFQLFQTGVTLGRDLDWSDDPDAPRVALVNRRFVERHLAGESPLGRRFQLNPGSSPEWVTIVGVVPDLGSRGREEHETDAVYLPLLQTGDRAVSVVLRTTGDPLAQIPVLREASREIDPDVPVFEEDRLDAVLSRATAGERLFGGLFSVFGGSALIMASVGLFGMVAFAVRQRSRELGIRIALGARPGEIVGQVARSAGLQLGAGLLIGLALAALLAPLAGNALMGADPHDWRMYGLVSLTLASAGALACWIPARRALRLAPSDVLREE